MLQQMREKEQQLIIYVFVKPALLTILVRVGLDTTKSTT